MKFIFFIRLARFFRFLDEQIAPRIFYATKSRNFLALILYIIFAPFDVTYQEMPLNYITTG